MICGSLAPERFLPLVQPHPTWQSQCSSSLLLHYVLECFSSQSHIIISSCINFYRHKKEYIINMNKNYTDFRHISCMMWEAEYKSATHNQNTHARMHARTHTHTNQWAHNNLVRLPPDPSGHITINNEDKGITINPWLTRYLWRLWQHINQRTRSR